jgi:SAM-dependent methyltransferase
MRLLERSQAEDVTMKNFLATDFDLEDADLVSVIDEVPLWSAPFGLGLLQVVRMAPNMNVLDVGSGLGFPMLELAQRLGPSSRVFGIDPWSRAVERTRLKIGVCEVANAEVIEGVAEEMPFDDAFFDLIVSNNGINNVNDAEASLGECSRVAKPGAQFVLSINLEETMIEFYETYEKTLRAMGLEDEVIGMREQIRSKRPPLDDFVKLLGGAGFKISEIRHREFSLRFLDGSAMLGHFLIRLGFAGGWKSILKEQDRGPVFDALEQDLNRVAAERGELRLTIPWVVIDCWKIP